MLVVPNDCFCIPTGNNLAEEKTSYTEYMTEQPASKILCLLLHELPPNAISGNATSASACQTAASEALGPVPTSPSSLHSRNAWCALPPRAAKSALSALSLRPRKAPARPANRPGRSSQLTVARMYVVRSSPVAAVQHRTVISSASGGRMVVGARVVVSVAFLLRRFTWFTTLPSKVALSICS